MKHVLFALLLAACSDGTQIVGSGTLVVETPADGADVFSQEPLVFRVKAESAAGIRKIDLFAGALALHSCTGGAAPDFATLSCERTFDVREFAGQLVDAKLKLKAVETDNDGESETQVVDVHVTPIRARFASPVPGADATTVRGTGTLEIKVDSEVPVESVKVTFDGALPLQAYDSEPWSSEIDWVAFLGEGAHTLDAVAKDVQGRTAKATMKVLVAK